VSISVCGSNRFCACGEIPSVSDALSLPLVFVLLFHGMHGTAWQQMFLFSHGKEKLIKRCRDNADADALARIQRGEPPVSAALPSPPRRLGEAAAATQGLRSGCAQRSFHDVLNRQHDREPTTTTGTLKSGAAAAKNVTAAAVLISGASYVPAYSYRKFHRPGEAALGTPRLQDECKLVRTADATRPVAESSNTGNTSHSQPADAGVVAREPSLLLPPERRHRGRASSSAVTVTPVAPMHTSSSNPLFPYDEPLSHFPRKVADSLVARDVFQHTLRKVEVRCACLRTCVCVHVCVRAASARRLFWSRCRACVSECGL
jgi:hypothetical protein